MMQHTFLHSKEISNTVDWKYQDIAWIVVTLEQLAIPSLIYIQARTQQGAQRARAPPLATVYSTVEYYDLPWHKRRRNINEHANVVQYKFHVKNAINSLYILSISWPEV